MDSDIPNYNWEGVGEVLQFDVLPFDVSITSDLIPSVLVGSGLIMIMEPSFFPQWELKIIWAMKVLCCSSNSMFSKMYFTLSISASDHT